MGNNKKLIVIIAKIPHFGIFGILHKIIVSKSLKFINYFTQNPSDTLYRV